MVTYVLNFQQAYALRWLAGNRRDPTQVQREKDMDKLASLNVYAPVPKESEYYPFFVLRILMHVVIDELEECPDKQVLTRKYVTSL